jgi:hypothetical protein
MGKTIFLRREGLNSSWSCQIVFSTILDYFLYAMSSGKLEITLSKERTALYQCMAFVYKFRYVMSMSFKSIQVLDGNVLELSHSLMGASGLWVFSEMPLQRRYIKSKVLK